MFIKAIKRFLCWMFPDHDWRIDASWGLGCAHEHTREVNRYKVSCLRCDHTEIWRDAQLAEWFVKRGVKLR